MFANFKEASHTIHSIESIITVHGEYIKLRLLLKNKAKRMRDDFRSRFSRAILKIFEMSLVELISFALGNSSGNFTIDDLKTNWANVIIVFRKSYTLKIFEHRKDRGR